MNESSQAPDTAMTMDAFFAKYGADAALEADLSESRKPDVKANGKPAQKDQAPLSGDDDLGELDEETLQTLGLAEDEADEDLPSSEDRGTEQRSIDLDSLATALGLSSDDLVKTEQGVKIKSKVDGQQFEVSLEELRKGYQLQSHFTRQNEEFLKQRKEWEDAKAQQEANLQQQMSAAVDVLGAEERTLNEEYGRVDWAELRQDDPAEYAAKVAEYNQRLGRIRQRQQTLQNNLLRTQQEAQQKRIQQLSEMRTKEIELLKEKLGWDTQEKMEEGAKRLRSYLIHSGVDEQQVDNVIDHRTLVMSEKARRYDEMVEKIATARKKVAGAHPTPAGTSSPSSPKASKTRKLEEAKTRHKSQHSIESAAGVFKQLGII